MTRKSSSKANIDGTAKTPKENCKEPPVERFRSLEELNREFIPRRLADCGPSTCGFRTLRELTQNFQHQRETDKEARKVQQPPPKEVEQTSPIGASTGILKKIFEGRGFGFIAPDRDHGDGDVFLHFSDISGGGARGLGVGARVRYDGEPDVASGRLRAKNVSILSSVTNEAPSREQNHEDAPGICPPTSRAYNRDIMLGIFKALVAKPSVLASKRPRLKIFTVAIPSIADAETENIEDPHLDDERLLAKLEARLDQESGADAKNMETFGASPGAGWSYEEALAANEKLQCAHECEESTVGGTSERSSDASSLTRSHANSEDSDASEDVRMLHADAEAQDADDTWSLEFAMFQSKLLESNRHAWEVEQCQTLKETTLVQAFQ